jgi:CoA:oxalate CoA-transferase
MPMALEGIRIIDWTIFQQGPVATAMLGDLGAEVIKIEERERGDPGRGMARIAGVDLKNTPNFYFEANNRNKKSITLDLKKPEAREIVYQLVAKADVFVQNFRLGVPARLGLDYASLRSHNPRLIYASVSGYGPEGPDAAEPSYDQMGLARSGIMFMAGEPDMPPLQIGGGIADQMGGIMLAYGILAALVARGRSGLGQEVDTSHLGSMLMLQGLNVSHRLMRGFAFPRVSRRSPFNPLWNHYRCADDEWICLGMPQGDRYWANFCRAIGRPELGTDPRFIDDTNRAAHGAEAAALLDEIFASRPRGEWMRMLHEGGDFIYTSVNTVDDLPDDPQVRVNDYVVDFDHPRYGPIQVVGMPVRLRETPGSVRLPAPEFGQHTEEILIDVLGYDWERIDQLRRSEVI